MSLDVFGAKKIRFFLAISLICLCLLYGIFRWWNGRQRLGNVYLSSLYEAAGKHDFQQAFYWAKKGALLGLPEAQYAVAYYYLHGMGVGKDFAAALRWFEEAARQEHSKALYELSVMYMKGEGCEQDLDKGFELLQRFERGGEMHAEAAYGLGSCYVGRGDFKQAESYFIKALDFDPTYAKPARELGFLCSSDKTGLEDFTRARRYFELAAEEGDPQAFIPLGYLYFYGQGGEESLEKAQECFEIALAEPELFDLAGAALDELEAFKERGAAQEEDGDSH